MLRVDSAHASRPSSLVFAISADFATTTNFLSPGDEDTLQTQRLHLFYALPVPGLEVGISEGLLTNTNKTFARHTIQALGSPTLDLKYSHPVATGFGVGVHAGLVVPSAIHSNGVVPRASTLTLRALATYQPVRAFEVSLNAGYTFDNSDKLGGVVADQRLAFQVNSYSGANLGLGAIGRIDIANVVGLGPFAEVSGRINQGITLVENPAQATLGLKTYLLDQHFLELMLAADLRLAGKPKTDARYPGIFPWTAYAMLSVHLFDHPPPREMMGPQPCDVDAQCTGTSMTCHEHFCVLTTEVVKEVVTVKEVKQDTFTISGKVVDSETLRPVPDTVVTVAGFEKTPLSVDYKTGAYQSFPLDTGAGLLQLKVRAPGYKDVDQAMMRGQANENKSFDVLLVKADRPAMGTVRGSLKDARNGRPIKGGVISIVALQQKITTDDKGEFSAPVKAGRFDVLISAPHFATQRKKLVVHDGDVIVLNVDLATQK